MDRFIEFVNPIFQRVTGKQVIDPDARQDPIGIAITSSHFFDALEFVLNLKGLTYRENDRYYIVEEAPKHTACNGCESGVGKRNTAAGTMIVFLQHRVRVKFRLMPFCLMLTSQNH